MPHEEIVKEFREIRAYLEGKAKDIKARYGEQPSFSNDYDEWHYELLMQVCATISESASLIPLIMVDVPDLRFAHYGYGIEI